MSYLHNKRTKAIQQAKKNGYIIKDGKKMTYKMIDGTYKLIDYIEPMTSK